jgi:hypothetical protein
LKKPQERSKEAKEYLKESCTVQQNNILDILKAYMIKREYLKSFTSLRSKS